MSSGSGVAAGQNLGSKGRGWNERQPEERREVWKGTKVERRVSARCLLLLERLAPGCCFSRPTFPTAPSPTTTHLICSNSRHQRRRRRRRRVQLAQLTACISDLVCADG